MIISHHFQPFNIDIKLKKVTNTTANITNKRLVLVWQCDTAHNSKR